MSEETTRNRIGAYEILAVLGAGGMGKVYKVRNVFTDRIEAMKIVLPDLAGQNEVVERFLREIKVLARLDHPNIAALRTAQTVENQFVMVMEFVEGLSLSARVAQGPVPPLDAINYIDQVLAALAYAHQQHIIHRDIKPANMMLTPQGVVKLMDFGIARSTEDRALTMAGTSLGSLPYMSPEQITGSDIDARSDLYAVGVSLYEMVTGAKPFQADSSYAMMVAHLQSAPRPPVELQPGLPAELNQVILMAMAKEPAQRFQTADAFRAALKATAESLGGSLVGVAAVAPPAAEMGGAMAALLDGSSPAAAAAGPVTPPARPPAAPPPPISSSAAPPAPPAAAAWTPADSVLPPPDIERASSYRGLYMTLGALIVVAVLVAAGIYVPRWARTRAGGGNSTSNAQPSSPSASATAQPASAASTAASTSVPQPPPPVTTPPTGATAGQPATDASASAPQPSSTPSTPTAVPNQSAASAHPPQSGSKKASSRVAAGAQSANSGFWNSDAQAQQGQSPQVSPPSTSGANAQAESTNAAELEELENQMDQLATRATAAKESVESLRRQQQAQGMNLRGDISAAEDLMATYMDKAKTALDNKDAKSAKKYLDKAEIPLATLEKFLGRR